jgi:Raf kinase inhibitor-like YbhB/YbcL family protein
VQPIEWPIDAGYRGGRSEEEETNMAEDTITVTSTQFADGGTIPTSAAHALAGGKDISPDLSWSGAPAGTKSFVLTCYDPDAPTTVGFVHWVVFNLAPEVTSLPAGADPPGVTGYTDWGQNAYGGMAPPPGDPPHRYLFTVYALRVDTLDLGPTTTYAMLRFMIRDRILATGTLTGRFGLPAGA